MHFDGSALHLTLPSLPDLSMWEWWNWLLFGIVCNAVYGFVTHMVSLPAIRRYQDDRPNDLTDGMVFITLFIRMTVQAPYRLALLVLGLLIFTGIFISTFRFKMNMPLVNAFMWYYSPKELTSFIRTGHFPRT